MSEAFTEDEINSILSSHVTADQNSLYETPPGNETDDKLFLLSIDEVNRFFDSDIARKCASREQTLRAADRGGTVSTDWWLRSPGWKGEFVAYVTAYGSVNYDGEIYDEILPVRPAMWVNLES